MDHIKHPAHNHVARNYVLLLTPGNTVKVIENDQQAILFHSLGREAGEQHSQGAYRTEYFLSEYKTHTCTTTLGFSAF